LPDREEKLNKVVEELQDEVASLTERVSRLESLSGASASMPGTIPTQPVAHTAARDTENLGTEDLAGPSQSPWTLGGLASVMSRGAAVSLILLLALVLRTLTDGGTLGLKLGTILGMGYATALETVGLFMYRKRHAFAPIFSISGVLLLVAVVLEAHAGFGSISTIPAYMILAVAGGGMAAISWMQRATIPVAVSTVAVLIATIPLAFPKPEFIPLAIYLLVVNIMAFSASWLPRGWWLRIVVYVFTSSIFLMWSISLRSEIVQSEVSPGAFPPGDLPPGELTWFFAMIGIFLVYYIGISVFAIWRSDPEVRRPFDNILPTAASAGAYVAALIVVTTSGRGINVLGGAGVLMATVLLGIAALKAGRSGTRTRGTNTFAFPAAVLLALSFRDLSGESVVALAILSWAAFSLAWLSNRWASAGVRITGYFLQGTVIGASGLLLVLSPTGQNWVATVASMSAIAVVAFLHYRLVRKTAPNGDSLYFDRIDRRDISGSIPLLVSVGAVFLAIRAGLFSAAGYGAVFTAGQSLVLNLGAMVLFLVARNQQNAEIKWIAVLVTVLGGGKAFFYDLLKIKGLPVVVSVFSFGMAAAVGSWVLGQWHRLVGSEEGSEEASIDASKEASEDNTTGEDASTVV